MPGPVGKVAESDSSPPPISLQPTDWSKTTPQKHNSATNHQLLLFCISQLPLSISLFPFRILLLTEFWDRVLGFLIIEKYNCYLVRLFNLLFMSNACCCRPNSACFNRILNQVLSSQYHSESGFGYRAQTIETRIFWVCGEILECLSIRQSGKSDVHGYRQGVAILSPGRSDCFGCRLGSFAAVWRNDGFEL